MLYLKYHDEDGHLRTAEIYSDEIYSRCSKCGEEIQIDLDLLIEILKDGDFSSNVDHLECNTKPVLTRIK